MFELVLVRHGETVGQSSIRLYGATDIALSEVGEAQVMRAAEALKDEGFARVIASPLCRSRRAAELVAARQRPPAPVVVVPDLREVDFGDWEGLTFDEVGARDPQGLHDSRTLGQKFGYPGGESRASFWARVQAVARTLEFAGSGRAAAVLHKGVIKAVIAALTGMPEAEAAALPVSLAGYYRLRAGRDGFWDIREANVTGHLGELDLGG